MHAFHLHLSGFASNGKVKNDGQDDDVVVESGSEESDSVALMQHPPKKHFELNNGTQSSMFSNGM